MTTITKYNSGMLTGYSDLTKEQRVLWASLERTPGVYELENGKWCYKRPVDEGTLAAPAVPDKGGKGMGRW